MAEYEGNVLRPPGMGPEVVNPDVEELLASTVGYTQKGGTVAAGQGVLPVGQLLKWDNTTKYWVKATEVDAEGFNRNATDTAQGDKLVNIVIRGSIKLGVSGLAALDATKLAALETTLNGRITPALGWFTF